MSDVLAPERPNGGIYPYDVRYALQHRDARMGGNEIEALIRNGFTREGFYLTMKAATTDETQIAMLQNFLRTGGQMSTFTVADAEPALQLLGNETVIGGKLRSLSMYGPDWATKRFGVALGDSLGTMPDDTQLFMLANAPYVGFDTILRHSVDQGKPLGILRPDRFNHPDQPVGYMLTPTEDGVVIGLLPHDFERPGHALLFDDVVRTGSVTSSALNFWQRQASSTPGIAAAAWLGGL